jgi:hypothetical protein
VEAGQPAGLADLDPLSGAARTLPTMDPFPEEIVEHYDHEIDQDAADRELILWSARVVETEPSLLGVSSHLLAVARPAGRTR